MRYKYAAVKYGDLVLDVCLDTKHNNTCEGIFPTDSEQDILPLLKKSIIDQLKQLAIDKFRGQDAI